MYSLPVLDQKKMLHGGFQGRSRKYRYDVMRITRWYDGNHRTSHLFCYKNSRADAFTGDWA